MGRAENEALVRRIFDAFARKRGFALRDVFARDATWVVPGEGMMAGTFAVLASDDRAAALYRASGERNGARLDLDQVLLFRIEDGLVRHVLALPSDPAVFDRFWA